MHNRHTLSTLLVSMALLLTATHAFAQQPPPLPIEKTGIIETLPRQYPESWFLVHDASFFHMSDGKLYVIDTAADRLTEQFKGMFNIALIGNVAHSSKRGEFYATETFHSRGTRGDRVDVVTIWDQENLSPIDEVILPGNKRYAGIPERFTVVLLNQDRWLAVVNFSPATSVTLIDLESREIINEIATPGCTYAYPTGAQGFSSLCADGRFMSTDLDPNGKLVSQVRTEAFFSSDDSPIYERPAIVGSTAYFPTIAGLMFPVDLSGPVAEVGQPWQLVPQQERAEKWAPGGIGIIDRDDAGRVYLLMHPDSKDGSYQGGGPEVWVFDPVKQKRLKRIALKQWGLTLAIGRGQKPKLMVVNPTDMSLEMYDPETGDFIKTITGFGQETPLMVHRSN